MDELLLSWKVHRYLSLELKVQAPSAASRTSLTPVMSQLLFPSIEDEVGKSLFISGALIYFDGAHYS